MNFIQKVSDWFDRSETSYKPIPQADGRLVGLAEVINSKEALAALDKQRESITSEKDLSDTSSEISQTSSRSYSILSEESDPLRDGYTLVKAPENKKIGDRISEYVNKPGFWKTALKVSLIALGSLVVAGIVAGIGAGAGWVLGAAAITAVVLAAIGKFVDWYVNREKKVEEIEMLEFKPLKERLDEKLDSILEEYPSYKTQLRNVPNRTITDRIGEAYQSLQSKWTEAREKRIEERNEAQRNKVTTQLMEAGEKAVRKSAIEFDLQYRREKGQLTRIERTRDGLAATMGRARDGLAAANDKIMRTKDALAGRIAEFVESVQELREERIDQRKLNEEAASAAWKAAVTDAKQKRETGSQARLKVETSVIKANWKFPQVSPAELGLKTSFGIEPGSPGVSAEDAYRSQRVMGDAFEVADGI